LSLSFISSIYFYFYKPYNFFSISAISEPLDYLLLFICSTIEEPKLLFTNNAYFDLDSCKSFKTEVVIGRLTLFSSINS